MNVFVQLSEPGMTYSQIKYDPSERIFTYTNSSTLKKDRIPITELQSFEIANDELIKKIRLKKAITPRPGRGIPSAGGARYPGIADCLGTAGHVLHRPTGRTTKAQRTNAPGRPGQICESKTITC